MGKTPGRNLNSKFQRRPVPVGHKSPKEGRTPVHSSANGSAPDKRQPPRRTSLKVLSRLGKKLSGLWRKVLPGKAGAPSNRKQAVVKKRRFVLCVGSAAVVIAVVLLVLLAPHGSAASAPVVTPSLSAALPTPTATATPIATPVPTTAPDIAVSSTPTATPKPSPTETAKPSSTATTKPSPTATATIKPTDTPAPTVDINTLVKFYAEEADAYYDKIGYSNNHYEYTDEELLILARIIQTEAGGESDNGKIAVGNVVINRVLSKQWGSTIDAVKGGFAYHEDTVPKQKAISAAHAVLDDEVWVVPQNTYYFKTSEGEWRDFTFYGQIGNHYFYTRNLSTRYNGTDIPDALYHRAYKYARYGCKASKRVYRIQYMLKSLGYNIKKPDKYFGTGTKEALIKFQQDRGLATDGVAGPATIKALIRAFGVDKYCEKFT